MAKPATAPLAQLEALLPALSNDELLEFLTRVFIEGGRRADNYAALFDDEDDVSADVLNEGISLVTRLDDYFPFFGATDRVKDASRLVYEAERDLKAHTQAVRSDA